MRPIRLLSLSITLLAAAIAAQAQTATPPDRPTPGQWRFPREGQETREIDGRTAYRVAENFYAYHDIQDGQPMVVVHIAPRNVRRIENNFQDDPRDPPERRLTRMAGRFAIDGNRMIFHGSREFEGGRMYLFQLIPGGWYGARISSDHTRVLIMPISADSRSRVASSVWRN